MSEVPYSCNGAQFALPLERGVRRASTTVGPVAAPSWWQHVLGGRVQRDGVDLLEAVPGESHASLTGMICGVSRRAAVSSCPGEFPAPSACPQRKQRTVLALKA